LADAVFDEGVRLGSLGSPTAAETTMRSRLHKRAIVLYEETLTGLGGVFAQPNSAVKAKIKFQLARLYVDENQIQKSIEIWKELVVQNDFTDLKRESALRLAEQLEQQSNSVTD